MEERCAYCEQQLKYSFEKDKVFSKSCDHFIPISRGGYDNIHNRIENVCKRCNTAKKDFMPIEFISKLENNYKINTPYNKIPVDLFSIIIKNIRSLIKEKKKLPMAQKNYINICRKRPTLPK